MKLNNFRILTILYLFLFSSAFTKVCAQDADASPTILSVRYFLPDNKVPYLEVSTKKKVGRRFEPVTGISVNVYFNKVSGFSLLGSVVTAINGEGRVALPPSFKSAWDSANAFTFLAVSDSSAGQDPLTADITIKKAQLTIDTSLVDGTRMVTAQLKEKIGTDWVAVKSIEMKLGIKRSLCNLTVGDADTYTSDSTGTASAEFKRDSMPGDTKGNLILIASVEDNDDYGNLVAEKSVPWGNPVLTTGDFWHRSLWSTGNRAPYWLLFIALSIICGVWSIILYLVGQIIKIRKIGKGYEGKFS